MDVKLMMMMMNFIEIFMEKLEQNNKICKFMPTINFC